MDNIDTQAEREAKAMRRLREDDTTRRMGNKYKRTRQQTEYNKHEFDKLFAKKALPVIAAVQGKLPHLI